DHRTRLLHEARRIDDLPLALHRARAGDGDDIGATDVDAAPPAPQAHHRVLRLPLPAHLLVGLGHVDHFLHAGQALEARGVPPAVVADQAGRGALPPRPRLGVVGHFLDSPAPPPDPGT